MIAHSIVNADDTHDRHIHQEEPSVCNDRTWGVVVRLPRKTTQRGRANPDHSAGAGMVDRSTAFDLGLFAGHNRCEVPSVY